MTDKVGKSYFDATPDDEGKVDIEEWVVRTIRGGWVYAVWKNSITWGKLSSKHGDFGWLSNIPAWCRKKWKEKPEREWDVRPKRLQPTKLTAIGQAIQDHKDGDYDIMVDGDGKEKADRAIKTLNSMATRERNKRKKGKK